MRTLHRTSQTVANRRPNHAQNATDIALRDEPGSRHIAIDFASTSHSLVSRRARLDELSVSTSLSTSPQLRHSPSRSISMRAITTVNDEIGPLTRRARLRRQQLRLDFVLDARDWPLIQFRSPRRLPQLARASHMRARVSASISMRAISRSWHIALDFDFGAASPLARRERRR